MLIDKINKSKISILISTIGIFIVMLLCNLLTDWCVDDYAYLYSYADGTRITSVFQIFPSMAAHYHSMNGRLIAHFFAQLFLMLPPIIFKIINSAVFALQIYLIYKICQRKKEHNTLLLLSIFGLIWIFQPAFGQVNLWLDGACNYLWCVVAVLIFTIPFIDRFISKKEINSVPLQILFIISGFIAGAYSENASPAAIGMVFLLMGAIHFYQKERLKYYYYASFASSLLGFVFMMAAPAEWNNKAAEFSLRVLFGNFIKTLEMYNNLNILLAAFIILFVLSCFAKIKPEILITSVVLLLGSIASNFILVVASYYSERSAFLSAVLLIAACCLLAGELFETKHCAAIICAGLIILTSTFYYGCIGVKDIYLTHISVAANETHLQQCRDNEIKDVTLPMVSSSTKYSAFYNVKYLDTVDKSSWPNIYIARYYELDYVIGEWEQK